MPASVIYFIYLFTLVIRGRFLSFHIHLFYSGLYFAVIHRQRHGLILFMGMGTCYVSIPQEISWNNRGIEFKKKKKKSWASDQLTVPLVERKKKKKKGKKEKTNKMEAYLHLIYIILVSIDSIFISFLLILFRLQTVTLLHIYSWVSLFI